MDRAGQGPRLCFRPHSVSAGHRGIARVTASQSGICVPLPPSGSLAVTLRLAFEVMCSREAVNFNKMMLLCIFLKLFFLIPAS